MATNFWAVYEFNVAFGIFVVENLKKTSLLSEKEGINLLKNNEKLVNLRYSLINEEINELENDGIKSNNIVEIIDALSDILYVVYGAGASFGINLDIYFRQRMEETHGLSNNIGTNFDLVKNHTNYINLNKGPNELFKTYHSQVLNALDILKINLTQLKESLDNFEYNNITSDLVNLLYETYKMGCILNIDLDNSFDIVHKSNMSKLCNTIEEAKLTVENYVSNDKRYDTPNYRKSDLGNYYVIYNKSTGKILKSINYTPANFSSMFN